MVIGINGISGGLLSQLFTVPHPPSAGGGGPAAGQEGILQPNQVLVLAGHDHIEKVLEKFSVPRRVIKPIELTETLLRGAAYLFVNCGDELPSGQPQRIAEWVEAGGRLMTSDWMVYHLLQPAFRDEKGYPIIRHHNRLSTDESGVFSLSGVDWQDAAAGIFLRDGRKWKVVQCAYPVRIEDPQRVHVVARCPQLGSLCEGADILFLRFAYGRGEVVHLVSHWYEQEFDGKPPAGSSSIHRSSTFLQKLN